MMPTTDLFKVGETLVCLQYVERRDGASSINVGNLVKVTHAFAFTHDGEQRQDINVVTTHRSLCSSRPDGSSGFNL